MIASSGILRYTKDHHGYKLVVEIDPEISKLARALLPRAWKVQPQRYVPHVTLVRREVPVRLDLWGLHEGETVAFEYDPEIRWDETYFWLDVFGPALIALRVELGLPTSSTKTRPPDARDCFHTTVGNTKR